MSQIDKHAKQFFNVGKPKRLDTLDLDLHETVHFLAKYLDLHPYAPEFMLYDLNRVSVDIGCVLPALNAGKDVSIDGTSINLYVYPDGMSLEVDEYDVSDEVKRKIELLSNIILCKQYRITRVLESNFYNTIESFVDDIIPELDDLNICAIDDSELMTYIVAKLKVCLLEAYEESYTYLLNNSTYSDNKQIVRELEQDEELMVLAKRLLKFESYDNPFEILWDNFSLIAWICTADKM